MAYSQVLIIFLFGTKGCIQLPFVVAHFKNDMSSKFRRFLYIFFVLIWVLLFALHTHHIPLFICNHFSSIYLLTQKIFNLSPMCSLFA